MAPGRSRGGPRVRIAGHGDRQHRRRAGRRRRGSHATRLGAILSYDTGSAAAPRRATTWRTWPWPGGRAARALSRPATATWMRWSTCNWPAGSGPHFNTAAKTALHEEGHPLDRRRFQRLHPRRAAVFPRVGPAGSSATSALHPTGPILPLGDHAHHGQRGPSVGITDRQTGFSPARRSIASWKPS